MFFKEKKDIGKHPIGMKSLNKKEGNLFDFSYKC